mmetsp:Transcript_20018/g.29405  ORF Transcript_20018/g.29405 Transcript_20018/m.29405 type:complete len:80 (+) Transcript_20018:298-537(+)
MYSCSVQCNRLQHNLNTGMYSCSLHYNTLNTLQHTATHTLQYTATHRKVQLQCALQHVAAHTQYAATHTLHIAMHCNTS